MKGGIVEQISEDKLVKSIAAKKTVPANDEAGGASLMMTRRGSMDNPPYTVNNKGRQ